MPSSLREKHQGEAPDAAGGSGHEGRALVWRQTMTLEGEHGQVIGGYQQVPRGLWQCPSKLDIRFNMPIKAVHYDTEERRAGKAVRVECANGETFEADHVVLTTPLGVLKSGSIKFEPPLPSWKQDVIERMGFGLLNKVSVFCGSTVRFLTTLADCPCVRKSLLGAGSRHVWTAQRGRA